MGSALVYVHGTFHNVHLAVVPAAGGPSRDLPIEEHAGRYFFPSFSADGPWILYQHGGQVEVVAAGGGRPRVLAAGSYPAWGPGSTSVLFSNGAPGKERTVWQAPFDPARSDFAGPATPVTFGRGADLGAQASRDGGAIVFAAADEQLNLEELPFDTEFGQPTGAPRELTRGSQRISTFDASRDGRSFASYTHSHGSRALCRPHGISAVPSRLLPLVPSLQTPEVVTASLAHASAATTLQPA